MARSRPLGPARLAPPPAPRALRLLLLAALLLGLVTMHTLGHPAGGHGPGGNGTGAPGHAAAAAPHRATAAQPGEPAAPHPPTAGRPAGSATAHPAAAGTDPMSVCLAVLVGWTLLLLAAGPLPHRDRDAAAAVRARLLAAVRALPPPGGGRILLARLSVLRQ
ncbi:hypothetical protein ACFYUY_10695 [Kitasatospora sp. NPDC004745]|uniref:hypothetical protein n=1 Tax=Kitasatospora sp. NPDC004745 TaxID=3364019 RepID=UPI0036824E76